MRLQRDTLTGSSFPPTAISKQATLFAETAKDPPETRHVLCHSTGRHLLFGSKDALLLLAVSSLLLGIGMGLAGLADSTGGYCLAAAAAVPGEIILFIAAGDLVSRLAPPGAHGRYTGLRGSNLALAVIAAPLLAAWSPSHGGGITGITATWVICGTGALGAVLCWPLHSSIRTPDASTPRSPSRADSTAR